MLIKSKVYFVALCVGFVGFEILLYKLDPFCIAETYMDDLLETIKNGDQQALCDLFSQEAQNEDKIVNNAKLLLKLFGNDFRASNYNRGMAKKSACYGEIYQEAYTGCDIETSNGTYRVMIKVCIKDTSNTENIGIVSLYITRIESLEGAGYWGAYTAWEPGIILRINN